VTLPAESLPEVPTEPPGSPPTATEDAPGDRFGHYTDVDSGELHGHDTDAGSGLLGREQSSDVSPPGAPSGPSSGSGMSSPAAFIAVVAVGALVLIGCVLGATLTGVFGPFSSFPESTATPAPTWIDPSREALATIDNGQWLVTRDIRPGTYRTKVPASSAGCTWERNASTDGTTTSVLDSGAGTPGVEIVVTIKETDAVFQSQGCGVWLRIGA